MTFLRNGELVDANGKVAGEEQAPGAADAGEVEGLRQEVANLKSELAQAQAAALPEDAHARLVKVNGIGEKLADQALAALKAAPEPEPEE